jgi:YHS domain-containing protein
MTFLSRIVRFLFWLLVVSWSAALLRRVVASLLRNATDASRRGASAAPAQSSGAAREGAARRLVRDPVCGMHVAEELSIPLRAGTEVLHFCSVACRNKYIGSDEIGADGPRHFAAHA